MLETILSATQTGAATHISILKRADAQYCISVAIGSSNLPPLVVIGNNAEIETAFPKMFTEYNEVVHGLTSSLDQIKKDSAKLQEEAKSKLAAKPGKKNLLQGEDKNTPSVGGITEAPAKEVSTPTPITVPLSFDDFGDDLFASSASEIVTGSQESTGDGEDDE